MELLQFVESVGGSLIQSRSTHPDIFENVPFEDSVSTFRISTNLLGTGFIEAIANDTLLAIRNAQPAAIRGTALEVAVLEANNVLRIGRFGHKSQHASLESFAADAYLNEMGITTPVLPEENTSLGREVGFPSPFDPVPDPEDDGIDVIAFANFMRATKAPPRGPINAQVRPVTPCSGRSAAVVVTHRRSARPRRARASMAARYGCGTRWATRSFIRTAISCCTTSARVMASRCCRVRSSRPPRRRSAPCRCGDCAPAIG